jgi:hypothetical protein
MRESRTYGSVRGALSNERPYRDCARHGRPWERRRAQACPPYLPQRPASCRAPGSAAGLKADVALPP